MQKNNISIENSFLPTDIAIIGMAGRFPGADNIETFWTNIKNGVESIHRFTREELYAEGVSSELLDDPNYIPAKGILNNIESFDANFFGFNAQDAKLTDPQQRVFLEATWEALETAGYVPEKYDGTIGVYACMLDSTYLQNNVLKNNDASTNFDWLQLRVANTNATLSTQVSYRLNLTGPSINLATACSSSLVSILQACKDLQNFECDMAIAGTVCIVLPQIAGYVYQKDGIESPDGHCRTFDADAQGTVFGNGLGVIILKRLDEAVQDNDTIYAVIKGGNINNDGADKLGFYAPSVNGQANCISAAFATSNINPESIGFIEAWGTATQIGDPVEVEALTKAFQLQTLKKQFCAIGSVKTNIGHIDIAGGMAGLIKTVMALKNHLIPPTLHFKKANPHIDFNNSPFYVNTELRAWEHHSVTPRRAGINVSAIGGTNAFLILEEYIRPDLKRFEQDNQNKNVNKNQLLLLSARTKTALDKSTLNLINILEDADNEHDFANIIYTLQVGRSDFSFRRAVLCRSSQEASFALKNVMASPSSIPQSVMDTQIKLNHRPKIVFMFSGQGSEYPGMAYSLYHSEPSFAKWIDSCCMGLDKGIKTQVHSLITKPSPLDVDIKDYHNTLIVQPALFILEYALAKWLMSLGIIPDALIGHSLGEYVAACIADVIGIDDALRVIQQRAKLMSSCEPGLMLVIEMSVEELSEYLIMHPVSIAAINSSSSCVLSGEISVIQQLEQEFKQNNIPVKRLRTSSAFHSTLMEPILEDFDKALDSITFQHPKIPIVSNLTGQWIDELNNSMNAQYWIQHLRQTVNFSQTLQLLIKEGYNSFIEVGPGATLSQFAKNIIKKKQDCLVQNTLPSFKDSLSNDFSVLAALAKLWGFGLKIDWRHFHQQEKLSRVPLPTYPFERKKYWIYPDNNPVLLPSIVQDKEVSPKQGCWMVLSDNLGMNEQLVKMLLNQGQKVIKIKAGSHFEQIHSDEYCLRPDREEDLQLLLQSVSKMKECMIGCYDSIRENRVSRGNIEIIENNEYVPPVNDTEEKLQAIWQKIFEMDKISVLDDFMSLGGHSMTMLRILPIIEKTFNIEISIKRLQELGNIRNIANALQEQMPNKVLKSTLVNIRSGEIYPALFCLHPVGGTILNYVALSQHLKFSCPIYGLQDPNLHGEHLIFSDLIEMATYYKDCIQEIQQQGPYLLAGHSFGGILAVEIAKQLRDSGEKVKPLILFDAWAKLSETFFNEKLFKKSLFLQFAHIDNNQKLIDLSWERMQLLQNYSIPDVAEKIILFKAKKILSEYEKVDHRINHWDKFAKGGIEVIDCAGDHETILQPPFVLSLAQKLNSILMKLQNSIELENV